ncbi:alpha/beta hydrolase [Pendulispora brunnea]|uniref:Alpha/beta hydrolase n=1 Tax=Pendulispora brunnea TaxID=2905690 RepID=A0ABZ2JYJ2_9BACT
MSNSPLASRTLGNQGDVLVFVHGGAGPDLTWARQAPLAERWRLVIPWRRCFEPSPRGPRQDWEIDAEDLLALLARVAPRAHVVAHSYGGLGAAVAAAKEPHRFASLTLIEVPLWFLAEHDPEVVRVMHIAKSVSDPQADPELRQHFMRLAGLPAKHPDTLELERLARNLRDPGEARPDLAAIRAAHVPVAVVSGDHDAGIERTCDALARALGGERVILRGAGHAVARAPKFNDWLASFLESIDPILAFLRVHGADTIEHPGGTLLGHLVRTARRLESWGASPTWVTAGLCHATYGTDGFPRALLTPDRRHELADLIGPEAETIVYAYGCCDRRHGLPLGDPRGEMRDRFTGTLFRPGEETLRAIVELTCANEIDVLEHSPALREAVGRDIAALLRACCTIASPAACRAVDETLRSTGLA